MLHINRKKGFSFVEIVVIIAILVVLLAVFAPMLITNVETSRMQKDDSAMDELVNAVQLAITDSETFDETYDYSIPNNYMTYSDSSGVYGQQIADEEYWAPDGSGEGVTITFNPDENGNYDLSKGIVNDMTYGNGSVAEKRTAEGVKQCYFEEMGNQLLYSAVKQSVGSRLVNTSATYTNSSYTVFIRFTIADGTRKALVSGAFNGTNLSENCQAAVGSNTSSYDELNKPIATTPSGGKQNANYSNSDLSGGGTITSTPSYKDVEKCNWIKEITGSTIKWNNTANGSTYFFTQDGDKWTSNNQGKGSTTASSTWTIDVTEATKYPLKYFVSSESVSYDYLLVTLNGTQQFKVGGTSYSSDQTKEIILKSGTNTLVASYRKDGSVNRGKDEGYILLPDIDNSVEMHKCNKHSEEEHEPDYVLVPNSNTATCTSDGKAIYKCEKCTLTEERNTEKLGHDYQLTDTGYKCTRCGKLKACAFFSDGTILSWDELKLAENGTKYGYKADLISDTALLEDLVNYEGAFKNCLNLTSIIIPDSVTSIGLNAFAGCTSLTSITIPDSVTEIGDEVFWDCSSLTSITIPDSVTRIGMSAFLGCSGLTSITIPDGVTSICSQTFWGCSITSIIIPDSVTTIGGTAFKNCTNLTDVYYTGTQEQWNAITILYENEALTNATIHYNYVP